MKKILWLIFFLLILLSSTQITKAQYDFGNITSPEQLPPELRQDWLNGQLPGQTPPFNPSLPNPNTPSADTGSNNTTGNSSNSKGQESTNSSQSNQPATPTTTIPGVGSINLPQGPYSDAKDIIASAINWILGVLGALAALAIVYSGMMYITAGSNTSQAEKARKNITWAVIGVVLTFIAFLIVRWTASVIKSGSL